MGNDQGIFRDSLERNTKRILKDALLSGKTILLREGIMKVTDEHTKESMKSKKDSKHGISGQAELMNILLNYLSEEFKITHIDSTEIVAASVMEADVSYPKTPLMHALDFDHTEARLSEEAIKTEVQKASKKKQHVTSDEERTEGGFDRSALAKQRLMNSRTGVYKKPISQRPVVSSSNVKLTDEEKRQMAKFSGLSINKEKT